MKWLKRIGIALIVLLVIAAAIPFFVNLDDFIPRIEREASAKLKEPVTVKSLKFSMAHQHRVGFVGIQLAVRFVREFIAGERRPAL